MNKKYNYLMIVLGIFVVVIVLRGLVMEGLVSSINDDFQRPRAYFHPFTTEYESYMRSQMPPSDPRIIKNEKGLKDRELELKLQLNNKFD